MEVSEVSQLPADGSNGFGPTCVGIISEYYGRKIGLDHLRGICSLQRSGVSLNDLVSAFDSLSFEAFAIESTLPELIHEIPLPAIAHWVNNHFVVIYKAKRSRIYVFDPKIGLIAYSHGKFCRNGHRLPPVSYFSQNPNQNFFNSMILRQQKPMGWILL